MEFPAAFLTIPYDENPIGGFVWAWGMRKCISIENMSGKEKFGEQGLAGKAVIEVSLLVALLVMRALPSGRCRILC